MHERQGTGAGRGEGPALRVHRKPADPLAAVLMLHGGRADSVAASRAWHPARLRMLAVARTVGREVAEEQRLWTGCVRYRYRGWNGTDADPLQDAMRALAELERLHPGLPVVLVGHSMGGRAALRAAEHPRVRAVVALAPWCPPGEPVEHLRDRTVVVLHGDRDRVTDPRASLDFARRVADAGGRAHALLLKGGDHAMLRRAGTWHRLTVDATAALVSRGSAGLLPPALVPGDGGGLATGRGHGDGAADGGRAGDSDGEVGGTGVRAADR
ncbi:alpha/beta hydrolase [Streptomyces fructofermentans]|uniref:alpha/beta hydrolase n=1 Tax=Streptomyces fructofermentans TaxID=152141 RepID=UPI0037A633B0